MDPRAVIRITPSEAQAAAGSQARFTFAVVERSGVAYSVESAVSSWCRLLLPAGEVGSGELLVDVPSDAGPGRYALRLVATSSGRELAAATVTLRIGVDRPLGSEPCLEVLPRPTFKLQPDGSVVATLRLVNCGNVDVNLVVHAHHEDGWSFSVDEPQLVVGVQQGPITVTVTLEPPAHHGVDRGDRITIEVNAGTGWQRVRGRVPRRLWPWAAAAAAVVVAVGATGAVLASQDESPDNGTVIGDEPTDDEAATDGTTAPPPPEDTAEPVTEPVEIESLTVDTFGCDITVEWDATGNPDGRLELVRGDGEVIDDSLPVESGSVSEYAYDLFGEGNYDITYELVAYDSDDQETDRESATGADGCIV